MNHCVSLGNIDAKTPPASAVGILGAVAVALDL